MIGILRTYLRGPEDSEYVRLSGTERFNGEPCIPTFTYWNAEAAKNSRAPLKPRFHWATLVERLEDENSKEFPMNGKRVNIFLLPVSC